MPPHPAVRPSRLLCRSAGASLSSAASAASVFSALSAPRRSFTASAPCRNTEEPKVSPISTTVPPESPKYIKFPTPPQSEEVSRPPRRGHLPIPRDIFQVRRVPGRKKDDPRVAPKSDPAAFAANAAPLSQAEERGEPPRSEREALRRRMAASRRQSLQSGLAGLWTRQQQHANRERARATSIANRNRQAALFKPEGRDDVLTRPSVRDATAKVTAVIRDPNRQERQAEAIARTTALAQAKREARRDAIMELYQAAGKFIVDEQELEQRVNELFRPDYFKEEGYSYGTVNAENIWNVVGKPSSVQDMMSGITRTETKLFDSKRTELDRTTKRQKLVAEALTGGKMPV